MSAINRRLVAKGEGVGTARLVRQGEVLEEQLKAPAVFEALVRYGLGAGTPALLAALLLALRTMVGDRKLLRDAASSKARAEAAARRQARTFNRRLKQAAKLALSPDADEEVLLDNLHTGPVGKSSAKLTAHLDCVAPHVALLEERLKPYFAGESPSAQLAAARKALADADAAQEAALKSSPEKTLELQETKGKLLELIERVNGVARLAFEGQAELAARFNKDILRRASHKGGEDEEESEESEVKAAG